MQALPSLLLRYRQWLSLGCTAAMVWSSGAALAQSGGAPVGAMTYSFSEYATKSMGVPLLRPGVVTRVVESVAGAKLRLAGEDGGSGTLPAGTDAFYLEVLGHTDGTTTTWAGHRFELDEAATRAAAVGEVVLDVTSVLNTAPQAAFAGLPSYRVAVRPHWTLATLFGTGVGAKFNAAASVATADQVLAWNGAGFSVYYLRSGEVPQWRNIATGPTNQDGAIVPPGLGIYVKRQAGALTISVVGEVRTNRFVRASYAASQLLASAFPVDSSPADWKLATGAGLTAGTSAAFSDQLLTWNSGAFDIFYLRDSAAFEWRNISSGVTDYTHAKLFTSSGATLLLLRAAAFGAPPAQLVQAVPFSL